MPLPEQWAKPEDFATLFQYFWHRDFPTDLKSTGARRIDWTIHIGIIVRSIGDLMGVVTRFERGGRKDAIFRSVAGDEVCILITESKHRFCTTSRKLFVGRRGH